MLIHLCLIMFMTLCLLNVYMWRCKNVEDFVYWCGFSWNGVGRWGIYTERICGWISVTDKSKTEGKCGPWSCGTSIARYAIAIVKCWISASSKNGVERERSWKEWEGMLIVLFSKSCIFVFCCVCSLINMALWMPV